MKTVHVVPAADGGWDVIENWSIRDDLRRFGWRTAWFNLRYVIAWRLLGKPRKMRVRE